ERPPVVLAWIFRPGRSEQRDRSKAPGFFFAFFPYFAVSSFRWAAILAASGISLHERSPGRRTGGRPDSPKDRTPVRFCSADTSICAHRIVLWLTFCLLHRPSAN